MPQWYEKQVGPLPLGVWVGVVAVGVGASTLINRKAKASSSASAPATDATVAATDGAFGSLPAGVNLGGVVALPGGVPSGQVPASSTTGSTPAITDNISWLRSAENQLIAKGYDPALVDSALRAYINGQTLPAGGQAVINLALQLVGAPPSPPVTIPTPTPITPTPTGNNPTYGPIYPAQAPLPVNAPCPTGYVLVTGASGWTCATQQQAATLAAYLKAIGA